MVFKYFIFTTCDGYKFSSHVASSGTVIPEQPECLVPTLADGREYLLSIDPSTSSTGLVISDIQAQYPIYLINITRDRGASIVPEERDESNNYTTYTNNLIKCITSIINLRMSETYGRKRFISNVVIESPFYNPKMGSETYTILKQNFDRLQKLCSAHGITTNVVAPQAWKKVFLAPVKEEWNLKMNRSNKEEIRKYGMQLLQEYPHIKQNSGIRDKFLMKINEIFPVSQSDCWDAFGISMFYFRERAPITVQTEDGAEDTILRIGKEMKKTRKKVNYVVYNLRTENVDDILSRARNFYVNTSGAPAGTLHADPVEFQFCDDMSIEDNIRTVTELYESSGSPNVMFMSIFRLNIGLFRELYSQPTLIGKDGKVTAKIKSSDEFALYGWIEKR